eukprot:2516225-Rhodomonas_salina.2
MSLLMCAIIVRCSCCAGSRGRRARGSCCLRGNTRNPAGRRHSDGFQHWWSEDGVARKEEHCVIPVLEGHRLGLAVDDSTGAVEPGEAEDGSDALDSGAECGR